MHNKLFLKITWFAQRSLQIKYELLQTNEFLNVEKVCKIRYYGSVTVNRANNTQRFEGTRFNLQIQS